VRCLQLCNCGHACITRFIGIIRIILYVYLFSWEHVIDFPRSYSTLFNSKIYTIASLVYNYLHIPTSPPYIYIIYIKIPTYNAIDMFLGWVKLFFPFDFRDNLSIVTETHITKIIIKKIFISKCYMLLKIFFHCTILQNIYSLLMILQFSCWGKISNYILL